jgi:hypothetical protein
MFDPLRRVLQSALGFRIFVYPRPPHALALQYSKSFASRDELQNGPLCRLCVRRVIAVLKPLPIRENPRNPWLNSPARQFSAPP